MRRNLKKCQESKDFLEPLLIHLEGKGLKGATREPDNMTTNHIQPDDLTTRQPDRHTHTNRQTLWHTCQKGNTN